MMKSLCLCGSMHRTEIGCKFSLEVTSLRFQCRASQDYVEAEHVIPAS